MLFYVNILISSMIIYWNFNCQIKIKSMQLMYFSKKWRERTTYCLYRALNIILLCGQSSDRAFNIPRNQNIQIILSCNNMVDNVRYIKKQYKPSWTLSKTRGTPANRVGFNSMRSSLKALISLIQQKNRVQCRFLAEM